MYKECDWIKISKYSDKQVIWRYMDFTKFLSLLQYQSLFFCTCAAMQKMDPYEGEYTSKNLQKLKDAKSMINLPEEFKKKPGQYRRKFLENVGINCWHANRTENAAMWKVYLSSIDGIAIKTTIGKLKRSFNKNQDDTVYIGDIDYKNYSSTDIPFDYDEYLIDVENIANEEKNSKSINDAVILNSLCKYYFPLIVSKRKEFEYGKEIRIISPITQKNKEQRLINSGKFVKIDLNLLIDEIIISPYSAKWFVGLVKDVVEQYNLGHKKTYKSNIYEKI